MVLPEHVWGLSFIGGLILMGIRNFNLFGIQLMIAAAIIIILFYAKIKGPGAGSAAGVMMGVIACSSGVGEISLIGSLALSGMLAGIFRKLGRIGMVLGFIAGNAILAYSVNGSILPILKGTDIIVSSLLFLIVSERTIDELRNYLNRGIAVNAIENKEVECTKTAANKLNAFSKAVEELAITFNKVPTPQQYYSGNDVFDFCDTMVDRVCKKCSLCPHCWERDFNDTYQGMFSLIEILEQKGSITLEDMPKSFSASSCIKSKQIMDTANTIFELYRVNFMWRKRIGESRGILSDHLKGFSKVISTLANEIIQQGENCIDMEAKVDQALRNHGFYPALVEIHGDESGSKNILIKFKECIGINYCHGELEKIISNALGRRVARKEGLCEHRQSCTLEYVSSQMFGVTVGAAKMSKNNNIVCGDNHTFMELQDKKYLLALSDGMGSGEAAANNSKVAIDLLEKFLETGFDRDTAVRMINSALVLKSSEDSYATMDISAIDLYTGRVEFIKIGAAYSYIKKVDRVEVIKAASLPAGIFEDIELQLTDRKLGHGDILVMVSDGVSESKWEEEGERDWLVDFLEKNSSSNPQELADSIIERAILNYGDLVADDMTVLVAKVWERF
jgi:stage II sporulation protein E